MRKLLIFPVILFTILILVQTPGRVGAKASAAAAISSQTSVSFSQVTTFQAAGDVGGGVLTPGTFFPPTSRGFATLKRGKDWIQVNIQTSGLPPGAYTVWWIVFNNPSACATRPCGDADLENVSAEVSIFWATGKVVKQNGIGNFVASYIVGGDLGEPDTQYILGNGALDTKKAEIHNIIKYHGLASNDPNVLYDQLHTILGSCQSNANAVDLSVFGIHCFDPQAVIHMPPT